ncbi:MAG: tetratricopeptide repeat protein, partial [Cyclobacteriaceae bacterium]
EDALKYFHKSLEIRTQAFGESHPQVAHVYNGIGRTQISMGNYDLALESIQKALDIAKTTPSSLLGDTYNNIGVVYHFKGDYQQALDYYEQALQTREVVLGRLHKKVAESYGNIGLVFSVLGKYQTALDHYHKGEDVLEKILEPGHLNFSYIYNKMGIIYRVKGDYARAQEYYEKTLQIRRENLGELHPDVADVYINLGVIHERNGDYELSMEFTNRAIEIYESVHGESHPFVAKFYLNMGQLNFQQDRLDAAMQYYEKGLKVYLENFGEQHYSVANVYNNMGTFFGAQEEYTRAMDYTQKALAIRLNVLGEKHTDVAQSYVNLAELYGLQQHNSEALVFFQKALALRKEVLGFKHPDVALVYNKLGNLLLENDDYEKALEASQNALIANHGSFDSKAIDQNPALSSTFDEAVLLESLQLKAQILKASNGQTNDQDLLRLALDTYQICDDLIQQMSQGRLLFEDKIKLAEWNTSIYKEAIAVCMQLHQATSESDYLRQAFTYSEKSKSGVLRQMISNISAKSFGQIPDNLLALEKQIRLDRDYYMSYINYYKTQKDGYDTTEVNGFERELFALSRTYDSLTLTFERNYPKYHQLKFDPGTIDVTSLKKQLSDSNTALVEYFMSDTLLYAFTLTKNQFEVASIPVGQKLETLIQDFNNGLTVQGHSQTEQNHKLFAAANQLYDLLFKPVAGTLEKDVEKIVIIPDGLISLIPFELLLADMPEAGVFDYNNYSYLLKNYQISYAYSGTLWSKKVIQKNQWENQFAGYAPSYQPALLAEANELISYGNFRNEISDLKYTEEEVRNASSFFNGHTYTGSEATEMLFKGEGGKYQILHLAMHAIIDEENPLLSKLIFTQDNDTLEDGFLNAYELYNMDLTAELAVLSACNTGYGKLAKGEGVLSLGRAFAYAGCPSIVMSLWPAQDRATADIMGYFYEGLAKGYAKDRALREAKLQYLENASDLFTHPFYWAGFVVQGDTSPIEVSSGISWYWLLSTIPLLGIVMAYRRKRQ